MQTFSLVLGQDVCAYGHAEIEAESFEAAIQIAKDHATRADFVNQTREGFNVWDNVSDVEWDTANRCRIVSIENEATGETRDDIEIDPPISLTVWSLVIDDDNGIDTELFASEASLDTRCLEIVTDAWAEMTWFAGEKPETMPAKWQDVHEALEAGGWEVRLIVQQHEMSI